jgi:hypothetical protein
MCPAHANKQGERDMSRFKAALRFRLNSLRFRKGSGDRGALLNETKKQAAVRPAEEIKDTLFYYCCFWSALARQSSS